MNETLKQIVQIIAKYKVRLSIVAGIVLLVGIYIFNIKYTSVTAKFENLRPVQANMTVYYNGFKVGKVARIQPSKDYKTTLVTMVLNPIDLKLPDNVIAEVKKELKNRREYDIVDLIYPKAPSTRYLKNGSIIEGRVQQNIQDKLANLADAGVLDQLQGNANSALKSLNEAASSLSTLFATLNDVVQENRPNLKASTDNLVKSSDNLALTTKNLQEMTKKLDNAMEQQKLSSVVTNADDSIANFKTATENIKAISINVNTSTQNLNQTRQGIDSTLVVTNQTVKNIDEITTGINATLKKNFGGLRILFGKTIQTDENALCPK